MEDYYKQRIFKATLSERSKRYDAMVMYMKEAIKMAYEYELTLDQEAHNLFSIAYNKLAGARRESWRILSAEKSKYEGKENWKQQIIESQLKEVENELCDICTEAIDIINECILTKADVKNNKESYIFFLKMKGDYYRYKAEVEKDDDFKKSTDEAQKSYEDAYKEAMALPKTSPVRLGLALNFSAFFYEILKKHDEACKLAKSSFDDAIAELEQLPEEHYKDSTLIMQLLNDNLTLWTSPPDK
eukprot:Gregarina_sp_Pseudo_9__1806@NODE_2228_length_1086_cov_15_061127_g2052_i0_p1_GENE_NODE_2228_length_1086_cov_15_061127_g2052_i0NODE_2228_length_1086_cov_15_061127_g2052_i0_p1_ORF_typecomplete_len244_score41_791433/PF00244_20/1_2e76TPR_19/PF14559_6/6_2e03TPR_19/PF14559_6/0_18TPR_12/PF13424_6/57TPR_12/PF13424_6/1_8FIVAR/PF07554_13/2_9e03FIVAR/PF07554_13/0_4FIVAR/PF07554_13/2_2e02_NODE_2228_length_1086_cov_15_061127_g2052_i0130861